VQSCSFYVQRVESGTVEGIDHSLLVYRCQVYTCPRDALPGEVNRTIIHMYTASRPLGNALSTHQRFSHNCNNAAQA